MLIFMGFDILCYF